MELIDLSVCSVAVEG